jgi:hypothetical protein
MLVHKQPHYFGDRIIDWYKKHDFTHFDVLSEGNKPHLIPHKPNNAGSNFELFRQAQQSIIHIAGVWPRGLKTVPREHVEFKWAEHPDTFPETNIVTLTTEWLPCYNVGEFAFYVGPLETKGADYE